MIELVYVIGSTESTRVKIGRSETVNKRLTRIQRMSPVPLAVLWTTQGGTALESALHDRFKARRTHGEWFDFAGEDAVALISQAATELTLAPEDEEALYAYLVGLGNQRVAAEERISESSAQLRRLAIEAIQAGMRPSRIAKATGYTDGYVRQLRRATA